MERHLAEDIHLLPTTARDLTHLVVGRELGSGMSRKVYVFNPDKTLVIKQEFGGQSWQNVMEWKIWQHVSDLPIGKWFAPCVDISPNGIFLLQKRAEPLQKKNYPKKLPKFFTDMKHQNFGMIGKQFVCFDYGTIPFTDYFITKQMRKVDWTDYDE